MITAAAKWGASFIHRPLLVFHEAGHVIFMPLGDWLTVLGGTLGQLLMPAIMAGALVLPLSLGWAAWLLWRQYPRVQKQVTRED